MTRYLFKKILLLLALACFLAAIFGCQDEPKEMTSVEDMFRDRDTSSYMPQAVRVIPGQQWPSWFVSDSIIANGFALMSQDTSNSKERIITDEAMISWLLRILPDSGIITNPDSIYLVGNVYRHISNNGYATDILFQVDTNVSGDSLLFFAGNTQVFEMSRDRFQHFYFDNGSGISIIDNLDTLTTSGGGGSDVDFYEVGTTTAPNSITDNKFTLGRVSIGKDTSLANTALYVSFSGTLPFVVYRDDPGQSVVSVRNQLQDWYFGMKFNEDFFIRDQTAGTDPFIIENTAPSNVFYMTIAGEIGMYDQTPDAWFEINEGSFSQDYINVTDVSDGDIFTINSAGESQFGNATDQGAYIIQATGDTYISGKIRLGTIDIVTGSGTPESVVTAPVGSMFLRSDGGASTTLYIKESGTGNTGWVTK